MPLSTLGRSVLTVGCSAVYMYHVYSNMPEERQAAIQEAGWQTVGSFTDDPYGSTERLVKRVGGGLGQQEASLIFAFVCCKILAVIFRRKHERSLAAEEQPAEEEEAEKPAAGRRPKKGKAKDAKSS